MGRNAFPDRGYNEEAPSLLPITSHEIIFFGGGGQQKEVNTERDAFKFALCSLFNRK